MVSGLLPPLHWLPLYPYLHDPPTATAVAAGAPPPATTPREKLLGSVKTLGYDALAGLTTGAVSVAQSMAYAMLAGLPPVLGIVVWS
jgi:MFS superfamily sulfate permease-like transporter